MKQKLHEIIFEADTRAGRIFDIFLLVAIILSVVCVMLETVQGFASEYHTLFIVAEWIFTLLFTVEYALRIYCVNKPKNYIFSFFGIIDLLAILPSYISLFIPGTQSLLVVRSIRLLRVFRVLKLARYLGEARVLVQALKSSRIKITVFLGGVFISVIIAGTLMYLIEGEKYGFTSIPSATYWAIVTVTTVGYGDITPHTPIGQFLSSFLMILGYGIIAVPTGIVSVELTKAEKNATTQSCPDCVKYGHALDAVHCKYCGAELNP